MPDFFGVYDDLKVDEYLEFYAHLHGVPAPAGGPPRQICSSWST